MHRDQSGQLRRSMIVLGSVAVLAFGIGFAGRASDDLADTGLTQAKAKTDQYGDPLPSGASARMGTLRWRHGDGVIFVACTSDGKGVVTAGQDGTLRLWDRETGKEIRRFPRKAQPGIGGVARPVMVAWNPYMGVQARMALSKDGKTLAAVEFNNLIQLWNVDTGKPIREFKGPLNAINTLQFAPDGKSLAARAADRVTYLYDTQTGNEIRQIRANQPKAGGVRILGGQATEANGIAFSHDGKAIATAEVEFQMQKTVTYLKVTSTETGNEIRQIDNSPAGTSAVAYSPDGKVLAYGSGSTIILREADTGKEIRKINTPSTSLGLTFAPDSKTIAAKGRDQVVRLFEAESGKPGPEIGQPAQGPQVNAVLFIYYMTDTRDFGFTQDGKAVVVASGQTVRFVDVQTGKHVPPAAAPGERGAGGNSGGHRGAVSNIIITPDGKTMFSRGADNVIRRWNAQTGQELGQFAEPKGAVGVAFSPDCKTIAFTFADGSIRLHAASDGSELHKLTGHRNGTAALAFSADGKLLASRGAIDNTIRLVNVSDGGERRQIILPGGANVGNPGGGFVVYGGVGGVGQGLAFSPDGQTLAASVGPAFNGMIRGQPMQQSTPSLLFWDVGTGKEIRKITLPAQRSATAIAFSPDGRLMAAENADQTVSLWEIASGRERALLGEPAAAPGGNPNIATSRLIAYNRNAGPTGTTLAFSPDGALLVSRGLNQTVRVYEVVHAAALDPLKGHDSAIQTVVFSPDGKSIASGSADTTILVWNVDEMKRLPRPVSADLQGKDLDALWSDLAGDDAGKAGRSLLTLAWSSKQSIPYLRDRVKPAIPADVKKVGQWIIDLGSTNFTKRTIATQELEKLGELAIPALKSGLAADPALETRRRMEALLEKLITGSLSAEQVRQVRAVEALERSGAAEAREVLLTLANGAPGALITRHAQAALDRLKR